MDGENADRLAARLARTLSLPQETDPQLRDPEPGTVADLRAASKALRQAARYLLQLERRLSDQHGLAK